MQRPRLLSSREEGLDQLVKPRVTPKHRQKAAEHDAIEAGMQHCVEQGAMMGAT